MAKETDLLQTVITARQKVTELDSLLSDAKQVKETAELALVEYMDQSDLKSFKSIALGCSVVRKESLYVSISKEKKDEAMQWITEDMGSGFLIKPSIHNKTLSSFIGDLLKKGEKIPSELFTYFFKPEITITQTKTS